MPPMQNYIGGMAKNTGKTSERDFEGHFVRMGKRAYLTRLVDAAEIFGRVGKSGHVRPQPSDYILTVDGVTSYAEVKSTLHPTLFQFSLLKKSQTGAAPQILAAGGLYWIFVHSLALQRWFRVPFGRVLLAKTEEGRSSLRWDELDVYEWTP